MKTKEIRIRCWIEVNGLKFFGPGPAELLEGIQREGSIAQAAKEMGMSYKKAWDIIDRLNANSKTKFVRSFKGGDKGGRAEVTDHGKKMTARYRKLTEKLNSVLKKEAKLLSAI
jgi:molybdate transport system regulatory protein